MSYPDHFIPNSKKNKEWITQYIKTAYDESSRLYANSFFRARDKFHQIKNYVNGRQEISKYRKIIDPAGLKDSDKSWLNIDWNILPIVPKFRRMAIEILRKMEYDLQAEIVDPLANEDREKYYKQKRANITMRDALQSQGMQDKIGILGMAPEDPADFDELEMHMNDGGYRHQYAIEMEMALDLVMNHHNNWEKISDQIDEDLYDYGFAVVKEEDDRNNIIKLRNCDGKEIVIGYSKKDDFSDARHIGELRQMTIHKILEEAEGELDSHIEELKDLAQNQVGRYGNPTEFDDSNFREYRIGVLDMEFISTNKLEFEQRTNKSGNEVVGRAPKKKRKKNKYSSANYEVIYQGKWIVGTDLSYKCKLKENMKRRKNNLGQTSFSYHVIAPSLYNMQTYSLAEQTIAIADQIQIAWYKLQNMIARSRPDGIIFEITALENVPLGKGGKKLKPLEVMDLMYQRGDLVVRAVDDQGNPLPYKPAEPLINDNIGKAQHYFNLIDSLMQKLRDLLGFNEVTDGSSLDPKKLVGISKLQAQATNNSLAFLTRGKKQLTQNLANDLTLRIHDKLEKGGEIKGYVQALGKTTAQFFKASKNLTRYNFGMRIVDRPSAEDQLRLQSRIDEAMKNKEITIADAIFVENIPNIKLAEKMLAHRVKKNQQRIQMEQERLVQLNGEQQQKSAAFAENEKRKTQAELHAQTMEQIMAQNAGNVEEAHINGKYRIQEAQITAGREIQKKLMENDSKEYIADNQIRSAEEQADKAETKSE